MLYEAFSPAFYALDILWSLLGCFSLAFTASKVGNLRWSDLMVVPLGSIWFVTPFWWDESGKRLWVRPCAEDRAAKRKCRRQGHAWCMGLDPISFTPKSRTCSRCLRHEFARIFWMLKR